MELDIETVNGVTVIRVKDQQVDSLAAPDFKTEFLRLAGEGAKKMLVNLEEVKYMDSSGVGALLFGRRQVNQIDGDLRLSNLQDSVLSIIKIAMLDNIFTIYDSEAQGLADF